MRATGARPSATSRLVIEYSGRYSSSVVHPPHESLVSENAIGEKDTTVGLWLKQTRGVERHVFIQHTESIQVRSTACSAACHFPRVRTNCVVCSAHPEMTSVPVHLHTELANKLGAARRIVDPLRLSVLGSRHAHSKGTPIEDHQGRTRDSAPG